ncbi:MAG: DUF87 domain-containing protein [Defluviitaleaceae bacterium]|nr:DUF87 domain-containing protein [Defluviitaleaceae bacterium]
MNVENGISTYHENKDQISSKRLFSNLIQPNQLVGDLYSMNYETARVLIHDIYKSRVNGIPSLCFLIASRVDLNNEIDFKKEDSSVILLRVLDSTRLPNDSEAERIRVETAQRVSGETDKNWDSSGIMDTKTRSYLSYAAIECRIIGTFFLDKKREDETLEWHFGCDISNYYPNQGLKVFKPTNNALELIINYINPDVLIDYERKFGKTDRVRIGKVRYASTNRKYQNMDDIPVYLHPADLLAQKSAVFGMTRTGKSNTTKIIAKSVYNLRTPRYGYDSLRIGQIIFDPNGEYANENTQDANGDNPNALKNIYKSNVGIQKENEVVTYGLEPHPNDPERKIMKINFYSDQHLQIGKELINSTLQNENAQYIRNFAQINFEPPPISDISATTRYRRRVLAYRTLLNKSGFKSSFNPNISGLFNQEIRQTMINATDKDADKQNKIRSAAQTLNLKNPSWDALESAFLGLFYFLKTQAYSDFNQNYIAKSSTGESWADPGFESIIEMFSFTKAIRLFSKCLEQHSSSSNEDYADEIYDDLLKGKLVIIDQSAGDSELHSDVAKRILWRIFNGNMTEFRTGEIPKDILIYAEEAHNLLPSGNDMDMKDVWVRTAKEGAKLKIGLVYATQEVSSIHKNILKNTSNWFISHLNNTDETRELCKFYDFDDFEPSIRKAQDKGFLRVKTLSNYFVVPVQIDKFEIR